MDELKQWADRELGKAVQRMQQQVARLDQTVSQLAGTLEEARADSEVPLEGVESLYSLMQTQGRAVEVAFLEVVRLSEAKRVLKEATTP